MSSKDATIDGAVSTTKRTAGFWTVLFMVIGVQFGGLTTVWSFGATEGLKKLLLSHALIGFMYFMLACCIAELTSIVPFAGGSFGFCRVALGPFWGFMVGASEVLENIMKVVVCVFLISISVTAVFETDPNLEPVWELVCYVLLYGIHLRGGALLWYSVIGLGLITVGTVLMFCIGNTKDIDVEMYGRIQASTFEGRGKEFIESFSLPIWVYIGLEIVPQTCERVKNVNKNLPWAMAIGTFLTYCISFWVLIAVTCNFPGYMYPPAWIGNPFPFSIGFVQMFDTPNFLVYGPLFAIIPLFTSALSFMWGCGYQVASLSRSGLLPKFFAITFGENETPVVPLTITCVVQFLMCVGVTRGNIIRGIVTCYESMMIGASMVYVGMFAAFIVFRYRFDGMKRHWTNPFGIPGAIIGICLALILCISIMVLKAHQYPLITYFVFMGASAFYYFVYARHTQYFSKEEQKKFMKAYILNANKTRNANRTRKRRPKMLGGWLEPVATLFALPLSAFSSRSAVGGSMASSVSKQSAMTSATHLTKNNSVSPAPHMEVELPAKANDEIRAQEGTHANATGQHAGAKKAHGSHLRASWAASGSTKVGWSGKAMTMTESKKFLEVLTSAQDDVPGQLVEALPNQFTSVGIHEAAMMAVMEAGSLGNANAEEEGEEEREVMLQEIVEGVMDEDDDADETSSRPTDNRVTVSTA